MTNFEKYNALHNEVMKRLENGEITVESAKDLNDAFFDRYITEASIKENIKKAIQWIKDKTAEADRKLDESLLRDTFAYALKKGASKPDNAQVKAELKASVKKCSVELTQCNIKYERKLDALTEENANQVEQIKSEFITEMRAIIKKYPLLNQIF